MYHHLWNVFSRYVIGFFIIDHALSRSLKYFKDISELNKRNKQKTLNSN